MSNLGQFGAKNSPWNRSNAPQNIVSQANSSLQSQIMNQNALTTISTSGMVPFQQQQHPQVFQNAMGLQQQNLGLGLQQMANNAAMGTTLGGQIASNQIFQQVGAVSYPAPRGLNPTAFQTQSLVPQVQNNASGAKQRVLTGTVTNVHDNFGFVDDEIFFPINACVKGSNPVVGDRVLVEASYNSTMPFKWNATRIQVLSSSGQPQQRHGGGGGGSKNYNSSSGGYNAVPPPSSDQNGSFGRGNRSKATIGRGRERSRERDRDEDEIERKRRREERIREREKEEKKSPIRSSRRSRSPKARRRSRIVPRYMVQIPKIALDLPQADVLEVRRRYNNLYIPSDFFYSNFRWVDAFLPDKPFALNKPCSFHVMNKETEPVYENNAVFDPPDADFLFSAKVMLMSVPGLEEIYSKCCQMAEDRDRRDRDSEERDFVHPTRLINFLVGLRGKNETMAIGGPWSPSLDGANPQTDPSVLIKTAIRTCKALTGIDLSNCTQWYRFVELYYRRSESTHKGKTIPARVETVVVFLPDVWSCLPTRLEWENLHQLYKRQLERKLLVTVPAVEEDTKSAGNSEEGAVPAAELASSEAGPVAAGRESPTAIDEKDEEGDEKLEPTHYSLLDPKIMVVTALRNELKARNISTKGLKQQLVSRLTKALKSEAEGNEDAAQAMETEPEVVEPQEKKEIVEEKKEEKKERKLDEKERALLEKRYTLPEQPYIIVHPSKTAKSGKFDCTTMSLSLLLDYRPEDTKEHSFEVSLFAELFNEMLMRDFGFNIFRALYDLPEKAKEKEEKDGKDKKKKDEDKDKKSDDKEKTKSKEDKKKDDLKDEKKKDDKKEEKEKSTEKDVKESDKKEKNEEKEKEKEKDRDKKRDHRKSDESEDEEEEEEDRKKDRDKKSKKERVKLYTKDRHLLLSFVYFDQTHCGYIFDKDIEDLLYTLGLHLSRAQVRKLVSKVVTRDSLHYRKLTDKPREDDFIVIDDSEKDANVPELAAGNKKYLPVFKKEETEEKATSQSSKSLEDGMVLYQGALVDVGKLISQLERSDKARQETESRMVDLKAENAKLSEKYGKSSSTIKHLNSELKEYKEKLKSTEDSLSRISAYSKLYQSTLMDIRDKIDPVLKSTSIKEEDGKSSKKESEKEKKHEESKSRWEKEVKKEADVETAEKDS